MQQDIRKGFLHENYYRITDIHALLSCFMNWDIFCLQRQMESVSMNFHLD